MQASAPPSRQWSSSPSDSNSLQPIHVAKSNGTDSQRQGGPRRSSFNFLRRKSSGEPGNKASRSTSRGRMSKKQKAQEELLRQQREPAEQNKQPPHLPSHPPLPQINTFGGENARPDSFTIVSNRAAGYPYQQTVAYAKPSMDYKMGSSPPHGVPIPPIPGSSPSARNGEYVDPYERTESMTHRGRYSYASSAVSTFSLNSPRRVRRRRDPTPFNILIIGAKSSGKTSFINFLRTSLALPAKKRAHTPSPPKTAVHPDSPFTSYYLESEIDGERIGVTLWDSQGLEKGIVDLQLREMSTFLESKFEETFAEEQKVVRAPGVRDTHIHCAFLILDPLRLDANIAASHHDKPTTASKIYGTHPRLVGSLDEDLDLQVLRALQNKTTVIPVISKADIITTAHMNHLKRTVWDSLKQAKLDPLEALNLFDDNDGDEDGPDDGAQHLDERDEDGYNHSSDNADAYVDADEKLHHHGVPGRSSASSSDLDPALTRPCSTSPPTSHSPPSTTSRPTNPTGTHQSHRRTPSAALSHPAPSTTPSEPPYLPLSILSPDPYEPDVAGRRFPWGLADPYNADHCDFVRLRDSVFGEWRGELREASRERWYESWRFQRLKRRGGGTPRRVGAVGSAQAGRGMVALGQHGMGMGQGMGMSAATPIRAMTQPQPQPQPPLQPPLLQQREQQHQAMPQRTSKWAASTMSTMRAVSAGADGSPEAQRGLYRGVATYR